MIVNPDKVHPHHGQHYAQELYNQGRYVPEIRNQDSIRVEKTQRLGNYALSSNEVRALTNVREANDKFKEQAKMAYGKGPEWAETYNNRKIMEEKKNVKSEHLHRFF